MSPLAELAARFDAAPFEERLALLRSLGGMKTQHSLWEEAAVSTPVTMTDLLPADYPALVEVRFFGKNSMPMFTIFEKRMCRVDHEGGSRIIGYNHTGFAPLMTVVGPGYFQVREGSGNFGGVAIDYRQEPTHKPESWPRIVRNSRRLSRWVYNGTVDYLRRVAVDVYIGLATKGGVEPMPNFFLLLREPRQSSVMK